MGVKDSYQRILYWKEIGNKTTPFRCALLDHKWEEHTHYAVCIRLGIFSRVQCRARKLKKVTLRSVSLVHHGNPILYSYEYQDKAS